MKTYQDLLACGDSEQKRAKFILDAIAEHRLTKQYQTAVTADAYRRQENETIEKYQKLLRTMTGEMVPNIYTANHKLKSGFFKRFVTQLVQYVLGNGVQFKSSATKKKFGERFDMVIQEAAEDAITHGVSFVFYDVEHVANFSMLEFVPLYDEETGALRAGIRHWKIDDDKPQHITLYEEDGVTGYTKRDDKPLEITQPKRGYKKTTRKAPADAVGVETYDNYPSFPIVPLRHDRDGRSKLVGLREQIDAYDLIKSGFANDLDDANMIYWLIENAGGMDEKDIAQFLERLYKLHTAVVDGDDGAKATPHSIESPYQARETSLKLIRGDLYEDAMALDTAILSAGNVTATQIKAAYEPLNEAADQFEYRVIDCVQGLLAVAGLPAEVPTFQRSQISNTLEETQAIMMAATYLDEETIIEKLPFLSADEKERAKKAAMNSQIQRGGIRTGSGNPEPDEPPLEE